MMLWGAKAAEKGQSLILYRAGMCTSIPAICLVDNHVVTVLATQWINAVLLSGLMLASIREQTPPPPFSIEHRTEPCKVQNQWRGFSNSFCSPLAAMHFCSVLVWHAAQAEVDKSAQAAHSPCRWGILKTEWNHLAGSTCSEGPMQPRPQLFLECENEGVQESLFSSISKCIWIWTKHIDRSIRFSAACFPHLSSEFKEWNKPLCLPLQNNKAGDEGEVKMPN